MEAKTKMVKDLIMGLDLSREEALDVIIFVAARSGISFFDFPAVKDEMLYIRTSLTWQNEILRKLDGLMSNSTEKTAEVSDDTFNNKIDMSTDETKAGNKVEFETKDDVEKTADDFEVTPDTETMKETEKIEAEAQNKGEEQHFLEAESLEAESKSGEPVRKKRKYTRHAEGKEKTAKKTIHPKGYSVNGKKLGRPRKISSIDEMETYSANTIVLEKEKVALEIEADTTMSNKKENVEADVEKPVCLEDVSVEQEVNSETAQTTLPETKIAEQSEKKTKFEKRLEKQRQMVRPSQDDVKALEMGKELPLKLMYKTKEGVYFSDRVLNSLNPEGVVVPYRIKGKFFVVRIYNEVSGILLSNAAAYAKKLEKVNDRPWMILTPQQKESCMAVRVELNEVIKKVGGDLFEGNYLTNPPSYGNKPGQKIRFTVEI